MKEITLKPMTPEMYHSFFKEYQNDRDAYADLDQYTEYYYDKDEVDAYIQRQIDLNRVSFAIMHENEIVGELKIYDIIQGTSATLGIAMKNNDYKDRGFGTQAERLAIKYVFQELDIPVLLAASVKTNDRSCHVLEKVGFEIIREEDKRRYYKIERSEII